MLSLRLVSQLAGSRSEEECWYLWWSRSITVRLSTRKSFMYPSLSKATQLILHSAWPVRGLSYGPALVADHLQLVQSSRLRVGAIISNRTLLGLSTTVYKSPVPRRVCYLLAWWSSKKKSCLFGQHLISCTDGQHEKEVEVVCVYAQSLYVYPRA